MERFNKCFENMKQFRGSIGSETRFTSNVIGRKR